MPAETKDELIAIFNKEFSKLDALLQDLDTQTALVKDADDTSIKDVIAHRAHWIDLFLGWYHDGQAGKTVQFPAPGYKWNDLKRYNADLRAAQSGLDWPAAKALLHDRKDRLLGFLEDASNDALYGGPMTGANNDWTPGRWAEAAGPSHFRSASKYIRKRLRDLA